MWQLIKRLAQFAVVVAIVVVAVSWSWQELWQRRYPQRAVAKRLLEDRLGSMTPEQRRLANKALQQDPIMAVLAAEEGGWQRVSNFVAMGPDDILKIERLALIASLRGSIDGDAAARFANAAFTQLAVLDQVDTAAATSVRGELSNFSPTEYKNIGFDASYLLIAPKLTATNRQTFRRYQDVLTPVILAADPVEWNRLVKRFDKALPRVATIARDKQLGVLYAWVYMLYADLAEALLKSSTTSGEEQSVRNVLDFIGVNAPILTKSGLPAATIADQLLRMQKELGPDGKNSLFDSACSDGAIYWLIAEMQRTAPDTDRETAYGNAIKILNRYAGTSVPDILTLYAGEPNCFRAAVDALLRFDNSGDPDPTKRQSASKFLSHYQRNSVFKAELAKHGAKLIPALSVGGENALAEISRNPQDIYKYVTEDGTLITNKPWWTWVPGGSVVYIGREIVAGRTTELSDWVRAGADAVILVPVAKGGAVLVRASTTAGGKSAGRLIAKGAVDVGKEVAAKRVGRAAMTESLVLLRTAGIRIAKGSLTWAAQNRLTAAVATVGTATTTVVALCALYPDRAAEIIDNRSRWISERLEVLGKETGRAAAALPGGIIEGIWAKASEFANAHPLAAPIFYLLASVLIVTVLLMPVYLLKRLLPELYEFLRYFVTETFRAAVRVITWLVNGVAWVTRPSKHM